MLFNLVKSVLVWSSLDKFGKVRSSVVKFGSNSVNLGQIWQSVMQSGEVL